MLLHYGDLTDTTNLVYIISQVRPTEIYNLAAQSHVKVSFDMAEYTVSNTIYTFHGFCRINDLCRATLMDSALCAC